MKKLFILFSIALAAQVFMACSKDDNPIPGVDDIQNPQEVVTDQPANARQK